MRITKEQIEFIKINFPANGASFCANSLSIPIRKVYKTVCNYKIERIKLNAPIENPTHKICLHCYQSKELSAYGKCRGIYGVNSFCRECFNLKTREKYLQEKIEKTGSGLIPPVDKEEQKIKKKEKNKEWYRKNKAIISKKAKEYNSTEEYKKRNRDRIKNKRKTDPNFKIASLCRARIRDSVKKGYKSQGTMQLLGCSIEFLRNYLESLFLEGMTWGNHGNERHNGEKSWHIDHIKPCAAFDLTDPEQQKICFHYTNLQPLWEKDNLSKGDNYGSMS
jgi:hypothetical protein